MELSKSVSTGSLAMCVLKAGMTARLKWHAGLTTITIDLHSMVSYGSIHTIFLPCSVFVALLFIHVRA